MSGLAELGEVVGVSRSSSPLALDHTDPAGCAALLEQVRPDAVVLVAALSSPVECEREPARAWKANASSSLVDAVAAFDPSVRFVFLSTDQVHNGEGHLVSEAEPADPVNVYGRTRDQVGHGALGGVRAAAARRPALVLRLRPARAGRPRDLPAVRPGAFAERRRVRRLHRPGPDTPSAPCSRRARVRSAVYVHDVVEAVKLAVGGELSGCVNVGGPAALSRHDFCRIVAEQCGLPAGGMKSALSTANPGPVQSPVDISMDTSKLAGLLGRRPTSLEEALADMKLASPRPGTAKL